MTNNKTRIRSAEELEEEVKRYKEIAKRWKVNAEEATQFLDLYKKLEKDNTHLKKILDEERQIFSRLILEEKELRQSEKGAFESRICELDHAVKKMEEELYSKSMINSQIGSQLQEARDRIVELQSELKNKNLKRQQDEDNYSRDLIFQNQIVQLKEELKNTQLLSNKLQKRVKELEEQLLASRAVSSLYYTDDNVVVGGNGNEDAVVIELKGEDVTNVEDGGDAGSGMIVGLKGGLDDGELCSDDFLDDNDHSSNLELIDINAELERSWNEMMCGVGGDDWEYERTGVRANILQSQKIENLKSPLNNLDDCHGRQKPYGEVSRISALDAVHLDNLGENANCEKAMVQFNNLEVHEPKVDKIKESEVIASKECISDVLRGKIDSNANECGQIHGETCKNINFEPENVDGDGGTFSSTEGLKFKDDVLGKNHEETSANPLISYHLSCEKPARPLVRTMIVELSAIHTNGRGITPKKKIIKKNSNRKNKFNNDKRVTTVRCEEANDFSSDRQIDVSGGGGEDASVIAGSKKGVTRQTVHECKEEQGVDEERSKSTDGNVLDGIGPDCALKNVDLFGANEEVYFPFSSAKDVSDAFYGALHAQEVEKKEMFLSRIFLSSYWTIVDGISDCLSGRLCDVCVDVFDANGGSDNEFILAIFHGFSNERFLLEMVLNISYCKSVDSNLLVYDVLEMIRFYLFYSGSDDDDERSTPARMCRSAFLVRIYVGLCKCLGNFFLAKNFFVDRILLADDEALFLDVLAILSVWPAVVSDLPVNCTKDAIGLPGVSGVCVVNLALSILLSCVLLEKEGKISEHAVGLILQKCPKLVKCDYRDQFEGFLEKFLEAFKGFFFPRRMDRFCPTQTATWSGNEFFEENSGLPQVDSKALEPGCEYVKELFVCLAILSTRKGVDWIYEKVFVPIIRPMIECAVGFPNEQCKNLEDGLFWPIYVLEVAVYCVGLIGKLARKAKRQEHLASVRRVLEMFLRGKKSFSRRAEGTTDLSVLGSGEFFVPLRLQIQVVNAWMGTFFGDVSGNGFELIRLWFSSLHPDQIRAIPSNTLGLIKILMRKYPKSKRIKSLSFNIL